ncbi:antirestriction protein ArdA [Spirillospora sp. CA-294931]|uniref:antirestriction protein ArdA n=1 Tax=Spirillospora sp. CA-294931 TaxID=3240042 RepID=UPI003D8D3E5E
MRIYATSLTAESMGVHLGKWFDLAEYDDAYTVESVIYDELTMWEWRIDKIDASFPISLQTDLETLVKLQTTYLDDLYYHEAFELYAQYHGDVTYAVDHFEDAYRGLWKSLEDYALDWFEEIHGDVNLPGYRIEIDEIAWRCDHVELDGSGGTHIFSAI